MTDQKLESLFRIDLYPQEWLVKTAHMTPVQRGVYITVCCLIYSDRGPISATDRRIANMSNCSLRLVKSVVDNLVDNNDLIILSDGKIDQKRCERELKKKRTHLENSTEGGRKKAENESKSKENNAIASSDNVFPLSSLSLSPSLPLKDKDHDLLNGKKILISAGAIDRARCVANGWDVYYLENTFKEWVKDKQAPKSPDAAFLAWIPKFIKGKKP